MNCPGPANFKLPVVALVDGDAGKHEVIGTVPGGEGDVKEEDLKKVETPSFATELHLVRHLQLGSDQSQNQSSVSDQH